MKTRMIILISSLVLGFVFNSKPARSHLPDLKPAHNINHGYPQFVPGKIIVKFKPGVEIVNVLNGTTISGISSVDEKISRYKIQSIKRTLPHQTIRNNANLPDITRVHTFSFDVDQDVLKIAEIFTRDPHIEYAEPIPIHYLDITPNDPQFSAQRHLTQIHMPEAWDVAKGDNKVIIAIIDSGTDWEHSDLIDNIWTNEAEAKGQTGIDDDHNGYVDDIHGWDFAENDNNPTNQPTDLEGFYHGTVTAGIASARTNNNLFVSGVSWNCTIMPLKCGKDNKGDERKIFNWVEAIQYAADHGAHVINLSFGSFGTPSRYEQEYGTDYAYQRGALVVASAGNTPTSEPHYPSGYPHVLSVTWVDGNDILISGGVGSSSTYGLTVDVSAPGIDLLSLRPNNNIIRMSGSSSAAPVVSGLVALVKSQHPNWGPFQVMRQIVLTADNIDHLNPEFAGQIGSGRINGYRAVSEVNPAEIAPRIKPLGVTFSDSIGGDNDHIFERGETVAVTASYRNFSISPGINVDFILTSNDSDLIMTTGKYNYGYFPPDTMISMPIPFKFKVSNNARGKTAQIYVGWRAAGNFAGADTFKVIVGKIPILVVDDDFDDNNTYFPNAEKMYTNIIDGFNLNYALWDRYVMGRLGIDQLANFPLVIWLCGWAFPSLDIDDQLAISNFLDQGGSLFITGQDIGWDFNDPGGYGYQQRDFYAKYLHAVYFSDDCPINEVVGVRDDPIGNNLQFKIWMPGLTADYQFPDEIEPGPGATAVFEYAGGNNHKFGIKYKGDHKVVYFGMGLEAIDSKQETLPDNMSPVRTEVMRRVLNWLNFIDHQPISDSEDLTLTQMITCTLTNRFVDTDLVGLELHWRKLGEWPFTKVPMVSIGNNQYQASIPAPGKATTIEYYIKLVNTYYDWTSPQQAPDILYRYYVGPDTIKPTFTHTPLKSSINGEKSRPVLVSVSDIAGIDTTNIWVHYTTRTISDSIRLDVNKKSPGQFQGWLPAVFAYGDTVNYYFSAYDKAQAPNRGHSTLYSFVVGYEDFESGLEYWRTGPDGWGLDNSFARSGLYSINDSPNQNPYPNNRNVSIATNFGIDFSGTQDAALTFWTKVYLEINHDYGYVEVSKDGGNTWNQVGDAFNGFTALWKQHTISLSGYCGPGNHDIRIRFRMVADANSGPPLPGWFIDDVQIIEGLKVTAVTENTQPVPPTEFVLYQNYPNPFNPSTTIHFDLPVSGDVSLQIFNVTGGLVRNLLHQHLQAGSYDVQWNGQNDAGQELGSGMYFYQLKTNHFRAVRKSLLIK